MKSPLKPGRRRKKLTLKTPDEKKKAKSNEISRQFRSPVTK
jgi:hypothetical protein